MKDQPSRFAGSSLSCGPTVFSKPVHALSAASGFSSWLLKAGIAVSALFGIAAVAGTLLLFLAVWGEAGNRSLHLYVLPENFTGEMKVEFGVAGEPPLLMEDGAYVYLLPASGKMRTSTPFKAGEIRFYYAEQSGGRRQFGAGDGRVHGGVTGSHSHYTSDGRQIDSPVYVRYFIGSEEQYASYVAQQHPPYEAGPSER